MVLYCLIISLFGILSLEYLLLKRDLVNPAFLFTLGFFIASLVLSCFIQKWKVELHWTTFIVINIGNIGCFLGAFISSEISKSSMRASLVDVKSVPIILISQKGLVFLFFLQLVIYLIRIVLMQKYYGGSIDAALVTHTMALKSGTERIFVMPHGLNFFYSVSCLVGFVSAFLFPYYLMFEKIPQRYKFWLGANYILCLIGSLLSSGRTAMLLMLVSYFVFYLITMNLRDKNIKIAKILKIFGIIFCFLYFFQFVGSLIGREDSDNQWTDTVGVYIGAEIQNLDEFIEDHNFVYSGENMGFVSFIPFYKRYSSSIDSEKLDEYRRSFLDFSIRNDYYLGNVKTALQCYWHDFGFTGTFIVCFFIGLFMQWLYIQVLNSRIFWVEGRMSPCVFVYSLLIGRCFMSFFSEHFFVSVASFFSLNFWITYLFIYVILYKKILI